MSNKDLQTYTDILEVYERRSTCGRLQVAAVIVKDGRNIVSGWNGVLAGFPHCTDHFAGCSCEELNTTKLEEHRVFSANNELHAEVNCLGFAAKHGISVNGADMYVTYSPCFPCATIIAAAGIKRVFYKKEYDRSPEGIAFLIKHHIEVTKLTEKQE